MAENKVLSVHGLTVINRQHGTVTGVTDVDSFNENEIRMVTAQGKLLLKGEKLHIKELNLEKGEATVEGKMDSFVYLSKNAPDKKSSFVKRMFR